MSSQTYSHPDADRLAAFVAGKLDAVASAEIEAHLEDCAVCQMVLEGLPQDTLVGLLRRTPAPADSLTQPIVEWGGDSDPPAGYELRAKLGEGGMGVVYEAWQR